MIRGVHGAISYFFFILESFAPLKRTRGVELGKATCMEASVVKSPGASERESSPSTEHATAEAGEDERKRILKASESATLAAAKISAKVVAQELWNDVTDAAIEQAIVEQEVTQAWKEAGRRKDPLPEEKTAAPADAKPKKALPKKSESGGKKKSARPESARAKSGASTPKKAPPPGPGSHRKNAAVAASSKTTAKKPSGT